MSDFKREIGFGEKVIKALRSFFYKAFGGIKVFCKVDETLPNINAESASSSDMISVDIPSAIDDSSRSRKGNSSLYSSIMSYSTSCGNVIIPNLVLGKRRKPNNTSEIVDFEYWGKVINGLDKMDSLTKDNYPFYLCPQTGTSILSCKSFEGTVNGVSEPLLFSKLKSLGEIEPEIEILKDVSLSIKNRDYGYKPDIAIVWKSRGICIDVEIDEPYDILSRKPIHYIDGDCNDYLRNAYFLENGWYVIRVTEEQVIKKIEDIYNYISQFVFAITEDERFKVDFDIEPLKRWSREEAQRMAENNYREGYLEESLGRKIEVVTPPTDDDDDYNIPNGYKFERPQNDIIAHPYNDLSDRLNDTAENNHYLRIKKSGNGYEYVTTKGNIHFFFHGIRLFDIVENKDYYLPFADIDSYDGMEDIRINKNDNQEWGDFIYDTIVNCRPIHYKYSKTSEYGPTERTVLYLSPFIWLSHSSATEYREKNSITEWLNGVTWNMHKSLCNLCNLSQFTGYCTYRKDIRTFNSCKILEGFAYNCYKPWTCYDTSDVLEVLEKGDGKLAEIIYSHFTKDEKKDICNIANNGHALVMQGRIDESLEIYRTFSIDYAINDEVTWGTAILDDINTYNTSVIKFLKC